MDYASTLAAMYGGGASGGGGGGGGGYSGEVASTVTSGGQNKAAFGTVNFGAGAKVGGTSTAEGDAGTGTSNLLTYVALGLAALVLVVVLLKR